MASNKKMIATSPLMDKLFANAGIGKEKTEQNWESLEDIYQAIGSGIVETAEQVNQAVQMIRSVGIENNRELAISVNGLTRDIEAYAETLAQIHKRHAGKTGQVKDGDELVSLFSIFEDYSALNGRMRANTMPVMLTITEHISIAANQLKEKAAQDAQDPNVVTDVVVKESVNE